MGSDKIDVDAFINSSLIEQAEIDKSLIFNKLNPYDVENHRLLEVPSSYLENLASFQKAIIDKNEIPYELLNIEQKMRYLLSRNRFKEKEFIKLFGSATNQNDLIYDWSLRRKLLELGIVKVSKPNVNKIRLELQYLKNALVINDLNGIYKHSWQISNFDFQKYTEEEKEIILSVLQIDSEPIAIAIYFSLSENDISYGTWDKYWKTLSGYKPGDDLEANFFLYSKNLCIEADYADERIDMSMFPNLPTVYDEDEYQNSDVFISNLDWDLKFEPYEIDFILAVAAGTFHEKRANLVTQINNYIRIHKISLDAR